MGGSLAAEDQQDQSIKLDDNDTNSRRSERDLNSNDITNIVSEIPNSGVQTRLKTALRLPVLYWHTKHPLLASNKVTPCPMSEAERTVQSTESETLITQVLERLDEKTNRLLLDQLLDPNKPIYMPHRYVSAKDEVYMGQYSGQNRHGYGIQLWPDGTYYEGHWDNDTPGGYGVLVDLQGRVYFGRWSHGRQSDEQAEIWTANGSHYKGSVQNGFKEGLGVLKMRSGDLYEGRFQKDQFHGKGRYVWLNKKIYEGDWFLNKIHGEGIMCWIDQTMYKGKFEYDQRHGYGEMISADGCIYQGDWKDGKKHGNAKFNENPGGPLIEARFEGGRRVS